MTITAVSPDGSFEGRYVNNAPGFECRGTPFAVAGWINSPAVGWTVNWRNASSDCRSVTSWGGVIVSPSEIRTSWSLGYLSPGSGPQIMTGSDLFTKQ